MKLSKFSIVRRRISFDWLRNNKVAALPSKKLICV